MYENIYFVKKLSLINNIKSIRAHFYDMNENIGKIILNWKF